MTPTRELDVLYEDNHVLAVLKPAGLATMGLAEGEPTVLSLAKEYLRRRYEKPGGVFLGIVSRLDGPVTGVVVLARTSKAAARLTEQFRERTVEKIYWAIVGGVIQPAQGTMVDYLREHQRHRKVLICGPGDPGAKEARLSYEHLRPVDGDSLVEIRLETGRKHQIRVQLAARGCPILGDYKYGSRRTFVERGIALHARRVAFQHPVQDKRIELTAPLPESWQEFGVSG